MINKQIYVTSLSKAVYRAKLTGKMDTKIIRLFNLFKYYIDFTQELSDNGSTQFEDTIICLKREISKLQYKYPNIICNYKVIIPNDNIGTTKPDNVAPTVDNNTKNILEASSYQFTAGDFLVNFSDINNDSWKFLIIYPVVSNDVKLSQDGINDITSNIIINIEGLSITDIIPLFIKRDTANAFNETFNFRVSDDPVDFLYSSLKIMTINGDIPLGNQPPLDIGDNTIYVNNRAVTVLSLAMFTSQLTPPYNDPEGDLIDAIKIIDISNANKGIYTVNGTAITEGQIITREDILANEFIHLGQDTNSISSDVFQFQARDEGSQIWID